MQLILKKRVGWFCIWNYGRGRNGMNWYADSKGLKSEKMQELKFEKLGPMINAKYHLWMDWKEKR